MEPHPCVPHNDRFEENYDKINQNIDEVYCIERCFCYECWAKQSKYSKRKHTQMVLVKLPKIHGNVDWKTSRVWIGVWRYMAVTHDGVVEKWWQEPVTINDGDDDDPHVETTI